MQTLSYMFSHFMEKKIANNCWQLDTASLVLAHKEGCTLKCAFHVNNGAYPCLDVDKYSHLKFLEYLRHKDFHRYLSDGTEKETEYPRDINVCILFRKCVCHLPREPSQSSLNSLCLLSWFICVNHGFLSASLKFLLSSFIQKLMTEPHLVIPFIDAIFYSLFSSLPINSG